MTHFLLTSARRTFQPSNIHNCVHEYHGSKMCNILLLNLVLSSSIMHTPYTVHSQAHFSYTVQFTPYNRYSIKETERSESTEKKQWHFINTILIK